VLGVADLIGRAPAVGPLLPGPLRHAVAVLLIGLVLFLMLSLTLANLGRIVAVMPQYQERLLAAVQAGAARLGLETEPTWQTLRRDVLGQVNPQRAIATAVASVSSIVAGFSLIVIYAGFMLVEREAFDAKLARLSHDPDRVAHVRRLVEDINRRIGTYLAMKTGINVLLGLLSYVILRVAGIEFAGFWALLIGVVNYVPYIGGVVGVAFPVALAVLQFDALGPVIVLTLALVAAQVLVGNFIEPWLMGSSLNLSPLVILVSLVAWSEMWGLAGAILAVPLMAILVIVLSEFEGTRWIAVLLSLNGEIPAPAPAHATSE
jgi:predicted PurR-regulated permease PerM